MVEPWGIWSRIYTGPLFPECGVAGGHDGEEGFWYHMGIEYKSWDVILQLYKTSARPHEWSVVLVALLLKKSHEAEQCRRWRIHKNLWMLESGRKWYWIQQYQNGRSKCKNMGQTKANGASLGEHLDCKGAVNSNGLCVHCMFQSQRF